MTKGNFEELVDAYLFLNVAYGDLYSAIDALERLGKTPQINEVINELSETRLKVEQLITPVMQALSAAGPKQIAADE